MLQDKHPSRTKLSSILTLERTNVSNYIDSHLNFKSEHDKVCSLSREDIKIHFCPVTFHYDKGPYNNNWCGSQQ